MVATPRFVSPARLLRRPVARGKRGRGLGEWGGFVLVNGTKLPLGCRHCCSRQVGAIMRILAKEAPRAAQPTCAAQLQSGLGTGPLRSDHEQTPKQHTEIGRATIARCSFWCISAFCCTAGLCGFVESTSMRIQAVGTGQGSGHGDPAALHTSTGVEAPPWASVAVLRSVAVLPFSTMLALN